MDLEREARSWVEAGIITEEQRGKILSLRPPVPAAPEPSSEGMSMAILALLWVGGSLVFLGIAFLLGIGWQALGRFRDPLVLAIDWALWFGGAWLRRTRPAFANSAIALLVIAGLVFPGCFGLAWADAFGSSEHLMGLAVLSGLVYAAGTVWLRSRAFALLASAALFWIGEEIVRDDRYSQIFPLVKLGIVNRLDEVFPVVFFTVALAPFGVSFLAGRDERFVHLRSTLFVASYIVALGPAIVGGIVCRETALNTGMAIVASLAALALAVLFRERKAFWVGEAGLIGALLVLFGQVFHDSIVFTLFAIAVGLATIGFATWMSLSKSAWLDRLFAHDLWKKRVRDERPLRVSRYSIGGMSCKAIRRSSGSASRSPSRR